MQNKKTTEDTAQKPPIIAADMQIILKIKIGLWTLDLK